jgi:phosphoribosylamine-glycine ligase
VFTAVALGNDLEAAKRDALALANRVRFEGKYVRRDIGYEFL